VPTEEVAPLPETLQDGVFALEGEWTVIRAAELRPLLSGGISAGARTLDLSHITEIDSAGLQLLIAARNSAARRGQELALRGAAPAVRALAGLYGLDENLHAEGAAQ
jgi:anti-anti-sigma factor